MPPIVLPGPADATPPEGAVAASLGKEMAAIRESNAELKERTDKFVTNEMLAASLGHIGARVELSIAEGGKTQAVVASLSDRLPILVATLVERATKDLLEKLEVSRRADREALSKEVGELFARERQDRHAEITAVEVALVSRIDQLDDKVNALDLRIGVSLRERDSKGEELAAEVAREAEEAEQEISKLHDRAKLLEATTKATAEKAKRTEEQVAVFTRGRVGFGLASAALALAAKSDATWASVELWLWSHGLLVTVAVLVAIIAAGVEIHARFRARKGPPT